MKADRQTPLACRNRRVGETTRAVRDRRLCFVVPVAGEYARMARALGNSVRHFHLEFGDQMMWRIDWILVKSGNKSVQTVTNTILQDATPPTYPSDHYPVISEFLIL
jgi:hypothetical protein